MPRFYANFSSLLVPCLLICFLCSSPILADEVLLTEPFPEVEQSSEEENPFDEPIETDRDSFTRSPRTVGRGVTVIEGSWTYLEQPNSKEAHLLPDLLYRFGATKRLELRLGWNYEVGKFEHLSVEEEEALEVEGLENNLTREYLLIYGAKIQVTEQHGWVPDSAVIFTGFTPTGGDTNDSKFTFEYAFGYDLPGEWELDAGLRFFYLSEEQDWFNEWAPSVVLKKQFTKRLNAHLEYFGQFADQRANDFVIQYLSPGAHFLVTPNLEVGVRLGFGLTEQSPNFFLNVGSGIRY